MTGGRGKGRASAARLVVLGTPAAALLVVALLVPLLSRPVDAVQERDPEIQAALAAMNLYRSWLGLEPVTINPSLQAAAEAHAEYYRLNYGDPNLAGMGLHMETPGRPGFTGETMQDRAEAHGYEGWVNENVGISGSMLWSLQWFMDTINHRLPIIDPRYTEVGLAAVNEGDVKFEIINFGMPEWQETTEPQWVIWPPEGMTGAGLSFSGEAPDPFPGASYPVGLPITISFHGEGGISLSDWSITANGQEMGSFGSVGTGFLTRRAALITSSEPLEYGTTYTVNASGTAGNQPFSYTWSFTTKYEDGEAMARDGESPPEPGEVEPPETEPEPTTTPTPEPSPPEPYVAPSDPETPPPPLPDHGDGDSRYPAGIQHVDPAVRDLWWQADGPVHEEEVERTWMWGPDAWAAGPEGYAEAGDGQRDVVYFDKARIEVNENSRDGDPLLTSGLLVRDMIAGEAQVGDDAFREIGPALMPIAGDALEINPDAPTYASLKSVSSIDELYRVGPRPGAAIIEVLTSNGSIRVEPELAGLATYGGYDPTLGHNVAKVFEDYMATLPVGAPEAVGLPLAEPYWMRVRLAGEERWVLVQAFERRVLTYTPSNDPAWQIEMGNVGRAYYEWRYAVQAPE